MNETSTLFEFERDFYASLRCIPMAVRFKLDYTGVKLSLKQWSRFQHEDRQELLRLPCDTTEQVSRYKEILVSMIASSTIGAVKEIDVSASPPWLDVSQVPQQLIDYCNALGRAALTLAQWRVLPPFRRYVLLKLSRSSHDNVNFLPALREFGLLPSEE
jgi:hypothetical protein